MLLNRKIMYDMLSDPLFVFNMIEDQNTSKVLNLTKRNRKDYK